MLKSFKYQFLLINIANLYLLIKLIGKDRKTMFFYHPINFYGFSKFKNQMILLYPYHYLGYIRPLYNSFVFYN
jgi:hypothetical protein